MQALRAGTNLWWFDRVVAPTDCASDSGGEEVVFAWITPETNTYTISTEGSDFDTVLYLKTDCLVKAVSVMMKRLPEVVTLSCQDCPLLKEKGFSLLWMLPGVTVNGRYYTRC